MSDHPNSNCSARSRGLRPGFFDARKRAYDARQDIRAETASAREDGRPGWALHPLENAALSRRTPTADIVLNGRKMTYSVAYGSLSMRLLRRRVEV